MTDQSDIDRHGSIDRLETEEEKDDDDLNLDDDIDEDEEDVEMDTPNELDDSGREDDDDDDGDVDMNINDDINDNEQAGDFEGDTIPIERNDAPDGTANDIQPVTSADTRQKGASGKPHPRIGMKEPHSGGNRRRNSRNPNGTYNGNNNISRTPSVRGLTIPFRTIKKSMKLDPDIPIVQNEAAIMATVAVELFLKRLVTLSHRNAKYRGRNTVRYEDVAEARTKDKALAFLETMLP